MTNQRRLGRTNLHVSEIGLGALEMGAKYGIGDDAGALPSEEEALALLRAAMEAGVTLFDTAGIYALSEARIGKFLQTTSWRPVITSKLMLRQTEDGQYLDYAAERPYPSVAACVDHQVRRSLRNLGVEAIDVMQLHGLPEEPLLGELTDALLTHVRGGRIRFLGASCGGANIPQLLEKGEGVYCTVQLAYSMLDQGEHDKGLKLAQKHDLGVLIRIPLALGVLAGRIEHMKGDDERRRRFEPFLRELRSRLDRLPPPHNAMSIPKAALRFVLTSPAVSSALTGTRRAAHIRANARAGDGQGLHRDVYDWVRGLAQRQELPPWSWGEHFEHDWPQDAMAANLELCRSVDRE